MTIDRAATLGKFRPPRLGRVFERERLFALLDARSAVCGTWIAGPPGVGKTTLVATHLQARATPCLWLQLDAADADPATFVHSVLAAAAAAGLLRRALRPLPPTADDLRDAPAFIRRSLRHLAAVLAPPWALVLDNVQELGPAAIVHAGIAVALAELPDGARMVLLSREPPPDAYARVLAGQHVTLIDERQLLFDEHETQRLVDLHGRDWSAARLQQLTDGWAAAMILLLATRSELGPEAAVRDAVARERLFAFFASEVLAGMSPGDAATLMRIAFLPGASATMAVALSGDPRAADMLAGLARRSLFTERREGTPPVYTFHALFSEFLQARAEQALPVAQLHALRVQAAGLLAAHGHADAAIAQLIQAMAWDEALDLIARHAGRFAAQGRTAMVRDWILAIPEGRRDRPAAWYWIGFCELAADPAQALRYLERAHHGYLMQDDTSGSFYTAAAAADAIVSIGANLHAIEPWMPVLQAHADAYLARRDALTDLRVLPGLLAAFVHRETAHRLTAALADRAEGLLDQPLGASQRILLGTLAYYLLWTGQTVRLDRMMVKVDRMCAASEVAPGTLLRWYGVSVLIRALLGRIDEARRHAQLALTLAAAGPAPMRAKAHLMMALAAVAGRAAAPAHTHLLEAANLVGAGNAIDATTHEFQLGLLMMLEGDWTRADTLMRAAVTSGKASGWPLREHIALLGRTLAATQVGDIDGAEAALQRVRDHPFHAVCRWHHWLADLIEAHLAERRTDRPRALRVLRSAFAVGRECGFDFGPMPFCCGDMMPRLAALALEHDIDPGFALHIIRRHRLPAPPDAGERWPWTVRIRTLGGFALQREGGPTAARKESRKPLDLLKLLIALGGGPVPVDRLCGALWPDAPGDAARNSFDNTLHRLRKLLGGDCQLLLQAGGLSLDSATCWTDVAVLEACLVELGAQRHDLAATRALAARALTLYGGPFLPGEDEIPELVAARTRFETHFRRELTQAGHRLAVAGQDAEAAALYERVMEQQPLAEDVCRHLIACLLRLGRRAEAFDAYRRCRQQLSVLLNLAPAPQTEALIDSIRDL